LSAIRKRLTDADKAKREEKRERRAAREAPAPVAAPTLGQFVAREDLVRTAAKSTRKLIEDVVLHVEGVAKRHHRVVSCHTCTAPKGCCKLTVTVLLHEVLPIAERLRREGRDTPALRGALAESAELMETMTQGEYRELRRPCVMLDETERCTVYEQRPRECGAAFVFTPPEACRDPAATTVEMARPPTEGVREQLGRTELAIEQGARLVRLEGPYMGVLPRMILLWLEAWDRPDYAAYLAEQGPLAVTRMAAATKKPPSAR